METIKYNPKGVCSKEMQFDVEDGKIVDVRIVGGCNGNLKGISRLLIGEEPAVIIQKLEGIQCGPRPTSCPDQIAQALKAYLSEKE